MSVTSGPNLVTTGLVLDVDAANPKSYSPNIAKNTLDIYGWTVGTNGACTIERDSTQVSPVGGIPCKMTITATDPYMATYNSTSWTLGPAKAGETWTVSCYVKSSVASGYVQMFIFGVDNTGSAFNLGGVGATDFSAGNTNFTGTGWIRASFSFTFSNINVTGVQVRLDGTDSGGVGQIIWFDGLQVEKASTPSTFNPITNSTGVNLYDVSVSRNSGTLINGPTYSTQNLGYLTYDGTTSYTSIANSTSLQVADTFTINSWVYPTNLSNRFGIFSTRTINTTGCWQIEVGTATGTGIGRVAVTGIGTWIFESVDNAVTVNNWFNICFVKPNNATQGGTLYVNGVQIGSVLTTAYTILNNSDNKMIAQGTGGGQLFPGRISQVSLYNIALTADQVLQNFNALRGRYNI